VVRFHIRNGGEHRRERHSFEKSLDWITPVERYISWADDALHGDFGVSYRYSKNMNEMMPVKELIGDKLPVTLYLAVISFVMIVLVSIPLGVLWAKCGSRFLDAVFGVLTQVTMAVPSFFLGILVTYLCGIVLKWFVPPSSSRSCASLSGVASVPNMERTTSPGIT